MLKEKGKGEGRTKAAGRRSLPRGVQKVKILCLLAGAALVLSACGQGKGVFLSAGNGKPGLTLSATGEKGRIGTLTVSLGGRPSSLDPAASGRNGLPGSLSSSAENGGTLITQMFEGLYRYGPSGRLEPAQAMGVQVSEDGLFYTFFLKKGLKWSDGVPLTASDFAYAWNRAALYERQLETGGALFSMIQGYDQGALEVYAPDETTFTVSLERPCPYFLEYTALPSFAPVSRRAVEAAEGGQWALSPSTYVSNGPYRMKEWTSSALTMERNPRYWDEKMEGPDQLRFLLLSDTEARLSAYKNGEAAYIGGLPDYQEEAWREKADYQVSAHEGVFFVRFSMDSFPTRLPQVRQALTLAADRPWICDNIPGAGRVPAAGLLPVSGQEEAKQPFSPAGPREELLEQARNALEQAGYPNGKGLPPLTYLYLQGSPEEQMGLALQSMWKDIGITLKLSPAKTKEELQRRLLEGDYDAASGGLTVQISDPMLLLEALEEGSGLPSGWSSEAYDSLLEQAGQDSSPYPGSPGREALLREAEALAMEDWAVCPLYFTTDASLANPSLSGYFSTPQGYRVFRSCYYDAGQE